MIDLEVVTRNIAAGSFCKRYGLKEEGKKLDTPVEELFMKSDALHDPLMNESDAIAFHLLTHEEHEQIWEISRQVNQLLTKLFADAGMRWLTSRLNSGPCQTVKSSWLMNSHQTTAACGTWKPRTTWTRTFTAGKSAT